jgi:chemotaxis signal transduction protein
MPHTAADDPASIEEEVPQRRLLLVSIPSGEVALPADSIVEVIPSRLYARLPGAAVCVAGLVNRRGRMLTVVDLGTALGGDAAAVDPGHRIVVVAFRGLEVGLAVNEVLRFTVALENGEENLRVVDVESLLGPHFGADGGRAGEPSSERP